MAAGENVPSLSTAGCAEFANRPDYWWWRFTNCISFSGWQAPTNSRKRFHPFHDEVQTDGISASVTMFCPHPPQSAPALAHPPPPHQPPTPPASGKCRKRKRAQPASTGWVSGLPDRNIDQTHRIVGLDPGRRSLFTAAIHSQPAADSLQAQRANAIPYSTLTWGSSRWREASGVKYRLHKTTLWLNRDFNLKATLEATPSAKVATVADFSRHVEYRMQYEAAAVDHFGDRRHRQLRWRSFIKRQQAYSHICNAISAGSANTVVAYGDASFSSSCGKGNPSTPTVSLRRKLAYHCNVFDIDEFRTSKLCCACKSAMDGMPLPVTGDLSPDAPSVL